MERPSKRKFDELRKIVIEPNFNKHAEGSCLIKCGDTHVICTATVEDKVPMWMRNSGRGWITAEYGMIPRATGTRTDREAKKDSPDVPRKSSVLSDGLCVPSLI